VVSRSARSEPGGIIVRQYGAIESNHQTANKDGTTATKFRSMGELHSMARHKSSSSAIANERISKANFKLLYSS